MKRLIRTIAILCFIWLTGGCEKDTEPTWIAPKMEIQVVPQDDIKRKSAILKGNIGENDLASSTPSTRLCSKVKHWVTKM